MYRIGLGQDSHKFATDKKPLVLGGVMISQSGGLTANSDGDLILHSLSNALSSALGGDSLSTWSDQMLKKGIRDSSKYLQVIFDKVKKAGFGVENVGIAVEAKKPYLKETAIKKIKQKIAGLLQIKTEKIGLTFTSGEGLTAFGRGQGIQATSIVLLSK